MSKAVRLGAWLGLMFTLGIAAAVRLDWAAPVQTDLLALLPADPQKPLVDQALSRNRDDFSRQMLILISGPADAGVRTAGQQVIKTLRRHGLTSAPQVSGEPLLNLYLAHRYALLPPAQSKTLTPARLAAETAANLGSPGSLLFAPAQDPGGDLARFVGALPQPYPRFTPDGGMYVRHRAGRTDVLLQLTLDQSGFSEAGPEHVAHGVAAARAQLRKQCGKCALIATGAPLFAAAAQAEGRREVGLLSGLSLLLIALLLIAVFHHVRPLLLASLCLVSSVFAATALVTLVFGSVHLMTLVCGTTLLGISIDYALHYLSQLRFGRSTDSLEAMAVIRPDLQLALTTSVLGFTFLFGAGFPALTQIALFSGGGLLVAYLTVELIFPGLSRQATVPESPSRLSRIALPGVWRWLLPLLLLLAALPGLRRLQISDDIRELQNFPPQLLHHDQQLRARIGRPAAPGFFLVTATVLDTAIERETQLRETVPGLLGLSRFVPPTNAQEASLKAWQATLSDIAKLTHAFEGYGLPASLARRVHAAWADADRSPLKVQMLLDKQPDLRRFILKSDGQTALITVPHNGKLTVAQLRSLAKRAHDTRFIAPLDKLADTFGQIRQRAILWVGIGYLLSAVLLWRRYRLAGAARVMLPPVLAVTVALGLLGWVGIAVNVFVVMALVLVLGIGIDYAIFLRGIHGREAATRIAVLLSAATTTSAFGLLALSRIPALHAFGLTIFTGIVVAFLAAPLAGERRA